MTWYYQLAIFIITLVVANAMRRPPAATAPAALEDLGLPQAEEGTPQGVIFGEVWVDDWVVLSVHDYRTEAIKK